MIIGQAVFNAETMNELVKKVEEGSYTVPTSLSKEMVSFLNGMLQYKGEDRLSSEDLYKHPFLTKNVRDFKKIDTRKVQRKMSSNGLNINVKKNHTIWGIFNEEDEKKLLQINARNYNAAPLKPIPEYPQPNDTKRTNTDVNIHRLHLNDVNKQYNKTNTNAFNYPGTGHSIYGQNMSPNPVPGMPQYPSFPPMPMNPYMNQPQPQSQTSYSSGMGGYNFPTFAPSPYTFSSNIYQNAPTYPPQYNYSSPPPVAVPPSAYGYSPMNNTEPDSGTDCSIQ